MLFTYHISVLVHFGSERAHASKGPWHMGTFAYCTMKTMVLDNFIGLKGTVVELYNSFLKNSVIVLDPLIE